MKNNSLKRMFAIIFAVMSVMSVFVVSASASEDLTYLADSSAALSTGEIILSDSARSSSEKSKIFTQYDTGDVLVDAGTVAARACYKSNSYATLDGYVYCNKYEKTRNIGAHTYSLVGDRTTSLFSTLAKFWKMEEKSPSSSIRKTCPSMSSVVQAVRYTTGETVSSSYTETRKNTYCLYHNPDWTKRTSYTLTVYSTLHNYYSSSNDFFMYPVVVNY